MAAVNQPFQFLCKSKSESVPGAFRDPVWTIELELMHPEHVESPGYASGSSWTLRVLNPGLAGYFQVGERYSANLDRMPSV